METHVPHHESVFLTGEVTVERRICHPELLGDLP